MNMENAVAPPPMGFVPRLIGIYTAPSTVFRELATRPTWVAPMLLVALVVATLNGVVMFSGTGEAALRQEFEERLAGRDVPPDLVERQLTVSRYVAPVSALVFVPVAGFALAGVVYLIFSVVLGGEATYRQTLSAYTHAGLIGVVGGLVATGMIFLKGNLKSSTSLAAFLPFLEESSFAYRFLQMYDLFILWQLAVLAIGMGFLNRIGTKKAAIVLFSALTVIALAVAGIRQMLS